MNIKKNFKKISAVLLAAFMVLAMAIPAFAADPVNLTVNGLEGGDTVTIYKIASVDEFGVVTPNAAGGADRKVTIENNKTQKITLIPASGSDAAVELTLRNATEAEINLIAAKAQSEAKPFGNPVNTGSVAEGGNSYSYPVTDGGIYVAQIVNKDGKKIYNPVLLAANVVDGTLRTDDPISQQGQYNNGTAKYRETSMDKEITGGIELDNTTGNDATDDGTDKVAADPYAATDGKKTADNKDDTIKYAVRIVMPVYPENATNTSLWMKDTLDPGIDYVAAEAKGSAKITDVTAGAVKVNGIAVDANGEFKNGNDVIGKITYTDGRSFTIVFHYENLKKMEATNIDIEYYGRLNDNCEIGQIPNSNEVEYYYSKNPSNGDGYKPGTTPTPGDDYGTEVDEAEAYTMKVGLVKTNSDETKLLKDAEFDLYDADPTGMLDDATWVANHKLNTTPLKSDANGIVEYAGTVAKGDYWFVETKAPEGYTLNATPQKVTATLATATYTKTAKEYTSDVNQKMEGTDQVGWLKNGKFYTTKPEGVEYNGENGDVAEVYPAYIKSVKKSVIKEKVADADGAVGYVYEGFKNSSTPELPSTGGIGTYIFTIIGVAIIAIAGFFIFRRRPQDDK